MVDAGLSRGVVNHRVRRIKRAFKWAVEEELVPPPVYQGLATVAGLRKGRSATPDPPPVRPVAEAIVKATLPFLPAIVADMVSFQRLTGCRPAEVCIIRPCDVDRTGEVCGIAGEDARPAKSRPKTSSSSSAATPSTVNIGST